MYATKWERYLTTNADTTSFALGYGYKAPFADTADYKVVGVPGLPHSTTPCYPGLELIFFGTAAENLTFDALVKGISYETKISVGGDMASTTSWVLDNIGKATCTTGATVGLASCYITATDFIVDTLVWAISTTATTPRGFGDEMETAYATAFSRAFSPANDETARLVIPVFPFNAFTVEIDLTGAATGNCIYRWVWP